MEFCFWGPQTGAGYKGKVAELLLYRSQFLVEMAISPSGQGWAEPGIRVLTQDDGSGKHSVPSFHLHAQPDQVESSLAQAALSLERQHTS